MLLTSSVKRYSDSALGFAETVGPPPLARESPSVIIVELFLGRDGMAEKRKDEPSGIPEEGAEIRKLVICNLGCTGSTPVKIALGTGDFQIVKTIEQ